MSHLVLVGAGHAHMMLMAHIEEICAQGHSVTVIGPDERHFYSGMGPGMLGGDYSPEEISFPVKAMCEERGATYIQEPCTEIKPNEKCVVLASGRNVSYDVASFNTGSAITDDIVAEGSHDVFRAKPIEELQAGRQRILALARKGPVRVGVVGGGPAGLEIAGNAKACAKDAESDISVRLYGGKQFMGRFSSRIQRATRRSLLHSGVEIVEGTYVEKVQTGNILLQDGQHFSEDVIFVAMGVTPRPLFAPSGIPVGEDGGMLVNRFLQSVQFPEIFGGGDCIAFAPQPLDKVGVYAVRENPVLRNNVVAALNGEPHHMQSFDPGGSYLLIFNVGSRRGVLHKNGVLLSGKVAFWIKDYIDRKFIGEFSLF